MPPLLLLVVACGVRVPVTEPPQENLVPLSVPVPVVIEVKEAFGRSGLDALAEAGVEVLMMVDGRQVVARGDLSDVSSLFESVTVREVTPEHRVGELPSLLPPPGELYYVHLLPGEVLESGSGVEVVEVLLPGGEGESVRPSVLLVRSSQEGLALLGDDPGVWVVEPFSPGRPADAAVLAQAGLAPGGAVDVLGLTGAGQVLDVADSGLDSARAACSDAATCGSLNPSLHTALGDSLVRLVEHGPGVSSSQDMSAPIGPEGDARDLGLGHGTHVASIAVGRSVGTSPHTVQGVAPGASLVFQALELDTVYTTVPPGDTSHCWGQTALSCLQYTGLPDDWSDLLHQGELGGAWVHNLSLDDGSSFAYSTQAQLLDTWLDENRDHLLVVSAGNSGSTDGTSPKPASMQGVGSTHNALSVGASETSGRSQATPWYTTTIPPGPYRGDPMVGATGVAPFTELGPAEDRVRPDLVAPGSLVLGARAGSLSLTTVRAGLTACTTSCDFSLSPRTTSGPTWLELSAPAGVTSVLAACDETGSMAPDAEVVKWSASAATSAPAVFVGSLTTILAVNEPGGTPSLTCQVTTAPVSTTVTLRAIEGPTGGSGGMDPSALDPHLSGLDSSHVAKSGTSMSAPQVAGAALLVREYLEVWRGRPAPSAALVRATLLAGARTLSGWAGQLAPPPHPSQGWGELDVERTLLPAWPRVLSLAEHTTGIDEGGEACWDLHVLHAGHPLEATLAWNDCAAAADNTYPDLNHDLDLRIKPPSGPDVSTTHDASNVEKVSVNAAAAGTWGVCVHGHKVAKLTPCPADGLRPFGLVVQAAGPLVARDDTRTPKAAVLVLDTSGSMSRPTATAGVTRLDALNAGVQTFLALWADLAHPDDVFQIVTYGTNPMLKTSGWLHPSVATELAAGVAALPTTTGGNTAIGAALNMATNTLATPPLPQPVTTTQGYEEHLFLMSDGAQNVLPRLSVQPGSPEGEDIWVGFGGMGAQQLDEAGDPRIHTIAITPSAAAIDLLATTSRETGGLHHASNDYSGVELERFYVEQLFGMLGDASPRLAAWEKGSSSRSVQVQVPAGASRLGLFVRGASVTATRSGKPVALESGRSGAVQFVAGEVPAGPLTVKVSGSGPWTLGVIVDEHMHGVRLQIPPVVAGEPAAISALAQVGGRPLPPKSRMVAQVDRFAQPRVLAEVPGRPGWREARIPAQLLQTAGSRQVVVRTEVVDPTFGNVTLVSLGTLTVLPAAVDPGGTRVTMKGAVALLYPVDRFGNALGPGRVVDARVGDRVLRVADDESGTYAVDLPPGVKGRLVVTVDGALAAEADL